MENGKKSFELAQNQAYHDWPMHYDPLLPEALTDENGKKTLLDTGMKILENGDITFRVYAPEAKSVHIGSGRPLNRKELELVKDEDGYFNGVLPFDPLFYGPHSLDFFVDGVCVLNPYMPISWHRDRPVNYIDLPDPETPYILMNDVPHGAVSRELYWSETMGRYQRCLVYTPAGYMKNAEEYPVLYLQHGSTENEVTWEYNGRVSMILDNLIAQGKAKPMIIVMNDGMVRLPSGEQALIPMLINDCIPYIEKTYRVRTDKWSRAMAGLSMGSMQTSIAGLSHPELFGYLGIFSGFLGNLYGNQNAHLAALDQPEKIAEAYKTFFRCIGDLDTHYPRFLQEDALCEKIKTLPCYRRVVYIGQHHEFGAWRRALYDFVQMIF